MSFEPWQWTLLVVGAAVAGFSKTGIPGTSILFVAIFPNIIPARQATGVVLPLLVLADLFAFFVYRKNLQWRRVGTLMPWALAGVLLGWWALGLVNDAQMSRVIGAILAVMLALHLWRQRGQADEAARHAPAWFAPVMGLFAGLTTMMANAAGPVMALYLLAMRLNKLEFLGTGAAFFLVINWIKVPFMVHLGLINMESFKLNLWLFPAVAAGALLGRPVVERVNQRMFESVVLVLAALAIVKLLVF
ncbi:sulfite exporter TauE/SafE family protein [Oleiharenicola lentus]|uniref:sulfite exporter TauE/SafE family protein n=1 Tax=Oleiharenicola lentus TaxID=2508720 RepID=UPI003F6672E5